MGRKDTGRGRSIESLVGRIRGEIASRRYPHGDLLPSTRKLAERFSTSYETVRRGLKQLEDEGLLSSEAKLGFRVSGALKGNRAGPVAHITDYRMDLSDAQPATWALSVAFQSAAAARGWSVLGAHGGGRGRGEVVEQLRAGNAWGVILDTLDPELCADTLASGLPVVMVNSWFEDSTVDVVLQDNYRGGFLAAEHLVAKGARRLGWIGTTSEFVHSRERMAGATACLAKHGLTIAADCVCKLTSANPREELRAFLGRSDRPDGLLAFWGMEEIVATSRELGLNVGRDFGAVGWVVDECYDSHYRPAFGGAAPAPAVVWRAGAMAERALVLLDERRSGAAKDPVRICVPTSLRFDEERKEK
ncbi:MAG TPA: GntR family transcriptional regulator [Planctomycetota bacterium]|nr:GntR family transcriptional regulator [Planctomycetota bacterium]